MEPVDRPPNQGETAFDASGKTHAQYVAKWDPNSLTGAMNRGVYQGVISAGGGRLPTATYTTGFGPKAKAEPSSGPAASAGSRRAQGRATHAKTASAQLGEPSNQQSYDCFG